MLGQRRRQWQTLIKFIITVWQSNHNIVIMYLFIFFKVVVLQAVMLLKLFKYILSVYIQKNLILYQMCVHIYHYIYTPT